MNAFIINADDNGNVYATLSYERKQKKFQGGIDKTVALKEKNVSDSKF